MDFWEELLRVITTIDLNVVIALDSQKWNLTLNSSKENYKYTYNWMIEEFYACYD
jgi:hypothetical protein